MNQNGAALGTREVAEGRCRSGSAIAALLAIGFTGPVGVSAQNAQVQAAAALGSKPNPDGTPVPRAPDGKADLSGMWRGSSRTQLLPWSHCPSHQSG